MPFQGQARGRRTARRRSLRSQSSQFPSLKSETGAPADLSVPAYTASVFMDLEIQNLAPKQYCLHLLRFTKSGFCSLLAQNGVYQDARTCPIQPIEL